jgi:hypothetical protein
MAKTPWLISLDFADLQKKGYMYLPYIETSGLDTTVSFKNSSQCSFHYKARTKSFTEEIVWRFICLIPQNKNAPNSHTSRNIVKLLGSDLSMQISQPSLCQLEKIMSCRKLRPSDEIMLWNVAWENSILCVMIWYIFTPKLKWTGKELQLMQNLKILDKFTRCLLERKGRRGDS